MSSTAPSWTGSKSNARRRSRVGFFGPKKPLFDEAASDLEKEVNAKKKEMPELRKVGPSIFREQAAADYVFNEITKQDIQDLEFWVDVMRKTRDRDHANFAITQFMDIMTRDWVILTIEAINKNLNRQREFTLRLLDVIGERSEESEQKLTKLREEMLARTLEPERKEVIDSILKAFKDLQDTQGKGR